MTTFAELQLAAPLQRALEEEGYVTPTPIQEHAIPFLLAGRDLLGLAQTGTGKTAAFALPSLHYLYTHRKAPTPRGTRVLVLAPTRELALQIDDSFKSYARHMKLRRAVVFGGVGQGRQVDVMRQGVDVLTAAPGRLLDLIGQQHIDLSSVEILVLDEADRMLDMGFIHDIRRIVALLPKDRQILLFSATMPKAIGDLAHTMLRSPAKVEVAPPAATADLVEQSVIFVDAQNKKAALLGLLKPPSITRAVVFTLMKHEANKVAAFLTDNGICAEAIHGNKSQAARERAMDGFRSGRIKVLVATDIAARGIDVDDVSLVVNYDLPNIAESYVHRIGRTARAGKSGVAVSLCDAEQRAWLTEIERTIGKIISVETSHEYHSEAARLSTLRPPVMGGKSRGHASSSSRKPSQGARSRQPHRNRQTRR